MRTNIIQNKDKRMEGIQGLGEVEKGEQQKSQRKQTKRSCSVWNVRTVFFQVVSFQEVPEAIHILFF